MLTQFNCDFKTRNQAFDQCPFSLKLKNGIMSHNRIYNESMQEIIFNPPIFDHVVKKLYLKNEPYEKPLLTKSPVYTFIKAMSNNYAHWLYDIMPCFRLFDYSQKTIYIRSNKQFQKEYLQMLGIENVIDYNNTKSIQSPELNFIYSGSRYDPSIIAFLKQKFGQNKSGNKLTYISRCDSKVRQVVNEKKLLDVLKPLGFEKHILSELPVKDQISLFEESKTIIMPHGAGAANLFYCHPNTRVIQFWPQRTFESINIYPKELIYHNLLEQTTTKDCMKVDINRLIKILEKL